MFIQAALVFLQIVLHSSSQKSWWNRAWHLPTAILLHFRFHMFGFCTCANIKRIPGYKEPGLDVQFTDNWVALIIRWNDDTTKQPIGILLSPLPHAVCCTRGYSDWFCPCICLGKNISKKDFLIVYTSSKHIEKLEISHRKMYTYLGVAIAVHCIHNSSASLLSV